MRILFATDGSREAQAAAHLLTSLPLEAEDRVVVVTVVSPGESEDRHGVVAPPHSENAVTVIAGTRDLLSHIPAALQSEVRRGHIAHEILQAAAEHHADLLVVGACGLSKIQRFLLGSVAERVARHCSCPVLVVRPLPGAFRRVVLGVDDSDCSTRAAEWIRRFPLPAEAEVRLVTVLPLLESWLRSPVAITPPLADHLTTLAEREREAAQERLHTLAASVAAGGRQTVTEIRSGDPALALLQAAEEEGADVIVVGSHGLTGVERFLLGSVSENALRHAHCSVLIVK